MSEILDYRYQVTKDTDHTLRFFINYAEDPFFPGDMQVERVMEDNPDCVETLQLFVPISLEEKSVSLDLGVRTGFPNKEQAIRYGEVDVDKFCVVEDTVKAISIRKLFNKIKHRMSDQFMASLGVDWLDVYDDYVGRFGIAKEVEI